MHQPAGAGLSPKRLAERHDAFGHSGMRGRRELDLNRQLDSVKETMARLRQEAGFFISDELFSAVLQEAGEA